MYEVLVPIDTNEERALAQARYVSKIPNSSSSVKASVLFVYSQVDEDIPEEFSSVDRLGSVITFKEHLENYNIDVELIERSGDPTDAILAEATSRGVKEIVLGGRKRTPAGKVLFGSVSQSVILRADLPTVVTGSPRKG